MSGQCNTSQARATGVLLTELLARSSHPALVIATITVYQSDNGIATSSDQAPVPARRLQDDLRRRALQACHFPRLHIHGAHCGVPFSRSQLRKQTSRCVKKVMMEHREEEMQ